MRTFSVCEHLFSVCEHLIVIVTLNFIIVLQDDIENMLKI